MVDEIYRGTVKKLVAREIAPQTETAINFFLKVGLNDKAWKKGDISEEMSSLLALDDKSRTPRSQRSDFSEELDESFIDSETRERLRHMTKEEARRVVKLMVSDFSLYFLFLDTEIECNSERGKKEKRYVVPAACRN